MIEAPELETLSMDCMFNVLPEVMYKNITRLQLNNTYPFGSEIEHILSIL
jgi:hypothetical protein